MIEISYCQCLTLISLLWILVRLLVYRKHRHFSWKREAQLLLVYICLIVVARFTFFPFGKVDGRIQPLLFDPAQIFPPWINLVPIVYMLDYEVLREAVINFVGNTTMFIPIGIVWPAVFPQLNTHGKRIAAGFGFSMAIEILQLPFFGRCSDVDDLILNTLGYLAGYGIWLLVKNRKK